MMMMREILEGVQTSSTAKGRSQWKRQNVSWKGVIQSFFSPLVVKHWSSTGETVPSYVVQSGGIMCVKKGNVRIYSVVYCCAVCSNTLIFICNALLFIDRGTKAVGEDERFVFSKDRRHQLRWSKVLKWISNFHHCHHIIIRKYDEDESRDLPGLPHEYCQQLARFACILLLLVFTCADIL